MMVKTTTSKLPTSRASPLKRDTILEDIVHTLLEGSSCTTEAFSVSERDAPREAAQIKSVSSLVRRSEPAFFCDKFFQVGMVCITNERGGIDSHIVFSVYFPNYLIERKTLAHCCTRSGIASFEGVSKRRKSNISR